MGIQKPRKRRDPPPPADRPPARMATMVRPVGAVGRRLICKKTGGAPDHPRKPEALTDEAANIAATNPTRRGDDGYRQIKMAVFFPLSYLEEQEEN